MDVIIEWREIPGFEGLYSVNSVGDIYSHYTNKILQPSISNCGYKQCVLHKDHKQYIMPNHRAVALAFIPRPNEYLVVNHIDEDKTNCAVDNLEWVTRSENNNYMGNRAVQATILYSAKEVYAYDKYLNLIDRFLGINKYAIKHGLSRGNLSSVINANRERETNFRTYKGIIYTDRPLDEE